MASSTVRVTFPDGGVQDMGTITVEAVGLVVGVVAVCVAEVEVATVVGVVVAAVVEVMVVGVVAMRTCGAGVDADAGAGRASDSGGFSAFPPQPETDSMRARAVIMAGTDGQRFSISAYFVKNAAIVSL